jgi:hypothetical protein
VQILDWRDKPRRRKLCATGITDHVPPEVKERFAVLGFEPVADTSEEFGALIAVEIARWRKVVRGANIRGE